jgi:hypothetical protein
VNLLSYVLIFAMALADELTIKDWIGFSRAVSDAYVQVDVPGTPFVCPCHGSLPRRASISEGDTVTMKYRAHPIYDETREASGTLSFKVGSRSAGPAFDAMARRCSAVSSIASFGRRSRRESCTTGQAWHAGRRFGCS